MRSFRSRAPGGATGSLPVQAQSSRWPPSVFYYSTLTLHLYLHLHPYPPPSLSTLTLQAWRVEGRPLAQVLRPSFLDASWSPSFLDASWSFLDAERIVLVRVVLVVGEGGAGAREAGCLHARLRCWGGCSMCGLGGRSIHGETIGTPWVDRDTSTRDLR